MEENSELEQILELQKQIGQRLDQLGFVGDMDARGNLIHHLAEIALWGRKVSHDYLPSLLTLPLNNKEELGELVADLNYDLTEMKEAIEDMEPALVKLMNFLTDKESNTAP